MVEHEKTPSLRSIDPVLAALIDDRLTLTIHDADHLIELMSRAADLAVEYISGADHAGITVVFQGSDPLTIAPTDERVKEFDASQYRIDAGPCLRATRTDRTVDIDMAEMTRLWPELAAVSRLCGISRVLAAPVHRHRQSVGSLNMYTDERTTAVISAVSPVLAILLEHLDRGMDDYSDSLAALERVNALRTALENRVVIENALGTITELAGCTRDEASDLLSRKARQENTTLRVAADRTIADRSL
ncbi:ANTAR domain-containing protein [Rhodococcus sovatensis]|uniref:ANTAR domain-containing protein n=1 Tax=Rhodococcus sovatensis TaxID=1805840 RepID=A0ABZ2PK29_9NOCA